MRTPFGFLVLGLLACTLGCRLLPGHKDPRDLAVQRASQGIKLLDSYTDKGATTYVWGTYGLGGIHTAPISAVDFGSTQLRNDSQDGVHKVTLTLQPLASDDAVSAKIDIQIEGGNAGGGIRVSQATTTTTIKTAKFKDLESLIKPVKTGQHIEDGLVLAQGVGGFPSLVIRLRNDS